MPKTFRKHEHLRSPAEFEAVYKRRCSVSDGVLIIYGRLNERDHARLGLSVSRKVGGAVERNRLRRIYREAFRLTCSELPTSVDLVLIPRSPRQPALAEVQEALRTLLPMLMKKLEREKT